MNSVASAGIPALRCTQCGHLSIPPKYICPDCGSQRLEDCQIDGQCALFSYTIIHVAPESFQHLAPYCLAVITLPHGLRVTALLENTEEKELRIGMPLIYLKSDDLGYHFRT